MYITYFVDPFLWVAIPRYPELSPALTAFVNLRVQLERTFLSSFTPLVTYTPFLATKSRAVIVLNSANETTSPGFGQSMYCARFISVYWLLIAIFLLFNKHSAILPTILLYSHFSKILILLDNVILRFTAYLLQNVICTVSQWEEHNFFSVFSCLVKPFSLSRMCTFLTVE